MLRPLFVTSRFVHDRDYWLPFHTAPFNARDCAPNLAPGSNHWPTFTVRPDVTVVMLLALRMWIGKRSVRLVQANVTIGFYMGTMIRSPYLFVVFLIAFEKFRKVTVFQRLI